ncbi:DUF262 domain-containing protein [Streptosporangium sp. NBC_01469]|uniref:DUF262 domain-containing protein n=1 Tax=Streptosporangium sp. NBC_01469 TaxID=2903898 RepID=UPI002E2A1112|nr:DUF262 domain-containing protein [Streptosporangium sp. NBC_01469]
MADAAQREVLEEHFLDKPLDVEAETDGEDEERGLPWKPDSIRVTSRNYSLRNVLDMIEEGELELAPDFQRNQVWKLPQKSGLIESILLQIPLPAFYFAQDKDGTMKVIDGLQRLSTAYGFAREEAFTLSHLEYLKDEEGRGFKDLSPVWRRRFHQTQLVVHVIDPQTPPQVKYDIFKRINTGGTPLNAQEIRHCLTSRRCRDFLKRCAELPVFLETVGETFRGHVRMADRELVLRFCAFRLLGLDAYRGSMDPYLDEAAAWIDDPGKTSEEDLRHLEREFAAAMILARQVFGPHAFRKWPLETDWRFPLNRPLFESWAFAFAEVAVLSTSANFAAIVAGARELMTHDQEYVDAISTSTGSTRKVKYRFDKARELVIGA